LQASTSEVGTRISRRRVAIEVLATIWLKIVRRFAVLIASSPVTALKNAMRIQNALVANQWITGWWTVRL